MHVMHVGEDSPVRSKLTDSPEKTACYGQWNFPVESGEWRSSASFQSLVGVISMYSVDEDPKGFSS